MVAKIMILIYDDVFKLAQHIHYNINACSILHSHFEVQQIISIMYVIIIFIIFPRYINNFKTVIEFRKNCYIRNCYILKLRKKNKFSNGEHNCSEIDKQVYNRKKNQAYEKMVNESFFKIKLPAYYKFD